MTSRHDLVWLTQPGWDAAIARAPERELAALHQWRGHDWPAVVRRQEDGVADDVVCLGIPLPRSFGVRQRLALTARRGDVARVQRPLPLQDALGAAPPQWLAALVALQRALAAFDVRVVGSLAMETLTGLPYLRAESDIDLVLQPRTVLELHAGTVLLEQHARLLPLDGEIVFPPGDAVAWREWVAARRARARVLVKSLRAVRLCEPADLAATLALA